MPDLFVETFLLDALSDFEEFINSVDEFMYFGNYDTPRCPSCRGWKKRGGHKAGCKRVKARDAVNHARLLLETGEKR